MKSKIRQHFKAVIVTGILLLCTCITLTIVQLRVHASTAIVPVSGQTPTVTNTATGSAGTPLPPIPTIGISPTVAVSPTTIPATPTPQPTSKPTQAPPKPTQAPPPATATPTIAVAFPANTTIFSTPSVAATSTSSPHAKATPTASPVPTDTPTASPTQSSVAPSSNNQNTSSGSGGIGASATTISVAAGAVLLLLIAGVFGLAQMRKQSTQTLQTKGQRSAFTPREQGSFQSWSQSQQAPQLPLANMPYMPQTPAPASALAFGAPTAAMALNEGAIGAGTVVPGTSFNTIVSTLSGKHPALPASMVDQQSHQAYSPSPMPPVTPTPITFNRSTTPANLPVLPEPYRAGDLRPITTALPKQTIRPGGMLSDTQPNPISTSDMSPLLPDGFDLTQILSPEQVTRVEQQPTPALPVVPPSIQDDPVLETIMRQAQMGLYANPEQSDELNDTQQRTPGNNSFLL